MAPPNYRYEGGGCAAGPGKRGDVTSRALPDYLKRAYTRVD